MFFNGIDFPNQIVDAIRCENLVVFAGAGASHDRPTSLPDFVQLANEIAKETGETLRKKDSCEVFLGYLNAKGINVNSLAAEILSDSCVEHNKLHEAIIDIFKSSVDVKIVTTNYDKMFEHVLETKGESTSFYSAPALPLGNDVNGIVHIHGNVDEPKYMVLTDEDFGRAYLTEGYVSKFLVRLFESYTVLFIGYSYSDTILRYLTRAMSRFNGKARYILTDDIKSDWAVLGIEPVIFPKRSFAVMREGVVRLGVVAKKGLVDWENQFEDISDMPPKDLTLNAEIDYCLENIERSRVMKKCIIGKEWMELLDRKKTFDGCFDRNAKLNEKDMLWSEWLCDNFVGKDDKSLFLLMYNHNSELNKSFTNSLISRLLVDSSVDTKYFTEYILLTENSLTNPWEIIELVEASVDRGIYQLAFILLKRLLICNIRIERSFGTIVDAIEYKHYFLGDYSQISRAWEMIKDKAVRLFPYDVINFAVEKIKELHQKYVMANQATEEMEPWSIALLEIEKREVPFKEEPLQILCAMLIETSLEFQNKNEDLLRNVLIYAVQSESVLLKRISLKVIRLTNIFDISEKLNILLHKNFIKWTLGKEQVFLLVASIFKKLPVKEKDNLIDEIESLGEGTNEKHDIYEVYNWCVWLQRVEPNNERINKRMKNILRVNKFSPREHPELLMWSSASKWTQDLIPIEEEQFLNLSPQEVIQLLENYNSDPFEGPSRYDLLNILSKCTEKDFNWAIKLINEFIANEVTTQDVWQYIFYGIRDAKYKPLECVEILDLIINNIIVVGEIRGASDYLWKIMQKQDIKEIFEDYESHFITASEVLLENRRKEKHSFSRPIDAALNTTVGNVIMSWIYMVSLSEEKNT